MSEAPNTGAGTTAPAAAPPAPPAAPPPVTPPAPQGASVAPGGDPPPWLNDRIAQAKKNAEAETLKALGVTNIDEAKAAVDAAKAAADAKKTAEQRAAELDTQLKAEREKSAGYETTIKARAAAELATLTPEQKAAVTAISGDDAAKQLSTIDSLRPTWAKPAGAPQPPPVPPPASTSQAGGAPPPTTTVAKDKKATLESLEKQNPMAAATFALRNAGELYGNGSSQNT